MTAADSDELVRYERSATSAIGLIAAAVGALLTVGATNLFPRTEAGLEGDLNALAGTFADSLSQLADSVAMGWSILVILAAALTSLLARRPRQALTGALAALLAAVVVIIAARVGGSTPGRVVAGELPFAIVAAALAVNAATASVFRTAFGRWSFWGISIFTLLGSVDMDAAPTSRVLVLLAGAATGSLVALVFGSVSLRTTRTELAQALRRARLPVDGITPLNVDARGSQPWAATLTTGRLMFVKVEAHNELRANQLFRFWRWLHLKGADDGRQANDVRRSAEHEAFVGERARAAGVRTPTIIAIGVLPDDRGVFTAFDHLDGALLSDFDEVSESALRSIWSQVHVLRRAGIAHRDLRLANMMCVDDDVWLIDFGAAEVAASDAMLNRDLAELLCSTAGAVGNERAVDVAVAVLGADEIAAAIPWIQTLALTTATREALSKEDLAELRERVRAASGIPAPEVPQLQRVTWKGAAVTLTLGVAIWTLLPQLTSGVDWDEALEANRWMMVVALLGSAATYYGAAISVVGSVPDQVPITKTFFAQVAGSFVNRITPTKVGAVALNVRYLSAQGIDGAVAAAGLAMSTGAGMVAHILITGVIILWAGNVGLPGVTTPPAWVLGAVLGVLLTLVIAVVLIPVLRNWFTGSFVPAVKRSVQSFQQVMTSPQNLLYLFGGSAVVTIGNLVAFAVSARAFGITLPFATLGVVYLAGSALASAAPTPGGLGAAEAALVAGLAVVGVPEDQAIPATLLFRLATFWIPILPGWIALVVMQRRGDL